jgi:DNA-binding NtrC family response regulator
MKAIFDGLVDQMLSGGISLDQATELLERGMIQGALARHGGNQSAAARTLAIHRNTLLRKMLEFGFAKSRPRPRKPAGRVSAARAGKSTAA